jgi:hypothetical protein
MSNDEKQQESSSEEYFCSISQENIPNSSMVRTVLNIESEQIMCREFLDDLDILLKKHCVINNE